MAVMKVIDGKIVDPDDGSVWTLLSKGVEQDGLVYCHIAHTTEHAYNKDGPYLRQRATWVEGAQAL